MAGSFFDGGSGGPRLLAAVGTHVFESPAGRCALVRAQPEGAVKDLGWADSLALEAVGEGDAEVACGGEKIVLRVAAPARLEVRFDGEGGAGNVKVGEPFQVRAMLYDKGGRELEVGQFTDFDWIQSENLEPANDPSAAEFGLCDTCFGIYTFRAVRPGAGSIRARLGGLEGELRIEAEG